jgi:hypothetical protein
MLGFQKFKQFNKKCMIRKRQEPERMPIRCPPKAEVVSSNLAGRAKFQYVKSSPSAAC